MTGERKPAELREATSKISEIGVGEVAWGIAAQAIKFKWDANRLAQEISQFAVNYAHEQRPAPSMAARELAERIITKLHGACFVSALRDQVAAMIDHYYWERDAALREQLKAIIDRWQAPQTILHRGPSPYPEGEAYCKGLNSSMKYCADELAAALAAREGNNK